MEMGAFHGERRGMDEWDYREGGRKDAGMWQGGEVKKKK
jgi:hypothetical protein